MGSFDIINNISEHITLVKFIVSLGNVNHTVNAVWECVFYSNNKRDLLLSIEYLNLVFSFSEEDKVFAFFTTVLYSVRCLNPKAKIYY